ncbi:hypothetical protein JTB14_031873 [Gonioctena quinquepunctata]|nr:hypothetical protein JTB14_031873 [Gonioctena quinquepunctata]
MEKFASEYEKDTGKLKTSQSSDQMDTDKPVPNKIQAPISRLAEEDKPLIVKSKLLQKEKLDKKLAAKEKAKKVEAISQRNPIRVKLLHSG